MTATNATAEGGTGDARPLLEVRNLSVHFSLVGGLPFRKRTSVIRAVDDVSFTIRKGRTLGLVGESGCGKSTTGRAIVRLNRPVVGSSIRLDNTEIAELDETALRPYRRRLQMIFQDPYSSLDPSMPIREIVREPLDIHHIGSARERVARVRELLHVVGMPAGILDRYPHQFSGGQRQRIGVARALALQPELIIADEPVSALDVSIQAQIINLMKRLQQQFDLTYLFIAHDLAAVRHVSDRVMVMYLGTIVETADVADLYRHPLHPYTVALLSAVPLPDPKIEAKRQRIILEGDVPSPISPPSGCRFHTRCWLWRKLGRPERCTAEAPPLATADGSHEVACHFAAEVEGAAEQRQALGNPAR